MSNAIVVQPLPFTGAGSIAYLANDYAGVVWQSGVGDAFAFVVDLGADTDLDTIMLFGVAGTLLPSAQLRISLATNAQGPAMSGANVTTGAGSGNFWQPAAQDLYAGSAMPKIGGGKSLWMKPAGGPPLFRYININVLGMGAGNFARFSRLVIGKRIQLARNFAFGGQFGVRDLGSFDFSPRGVLLRRLSKKLRTVNVTFPYAHTDEIEGAIQPLLETIGNTLPIALVKDPDAHAQRQNRMYFGPLIGELATTQAKAGGGWAWTCPMVSLF